MAMMACVCYYGYLSLYVLWSFASRRQRAKKSTPSVPHANVRRRRDSRRGRSKEGLAVGAQLSAEGSPDWN